MSDIRKWLKIMESVPNTLQNQPSKTVVIKKDATVMIAPGAGGGTARYMHSTPQGAMVDIKGVSRELGHDDFSLPSRDYEDPYENGNTWDHSSEEENTIGRMNDKPEFRPGDMVKIDDVYGNVIGPGFGVFIAYSTSGQECIISFDNKQIVVPTSHVGSVLEQNAKDNFSQTDNDGNLSPMSLGSQNVKIEKEPAMDQRDEFSKWMSAVEEALSTEGKELAEDTPAVSECGCGSWDCATCFPAQDEMPGMNGALDGMGGHDPHDTIVIGGLDMEEPPAGGPCPTCGHEGHEQGHEHNQMGMGLEPSMDDMHDDGLEEVGMFDEGDPVMDFKAGGGQVQQLPYKGGKQERRMAGKTMGSKHIGTIGGTGSAGQVSGMGANLSSKDRDVLPVVGSGKRSMDEEDMDFDQVEKSRNGKGVKLGDIVSKTEFRKSGGDKSPMTYGEDNLDEGPDDFGMDTQEPDYDADPMAVSNAHDEMSQIDPEEAMEMISKIMYMQDMGLSKANQPAGEEQLAQMNPVQLKKFHAEVMGDVAEETDPSKPTKTKTKHHLDDLDDVLNPQQPDLPATMGGSDDDEIAGEEPPMSLPAAGRDVTRQRTAGMNSSDEMRNWMGRINPTAGEGEPDRPETPQNELVVRTAADVPAVITNAIQASGMQSPDWHGAGDLPGMQDRNTRGMARKVMGMFTSTPLEQIQTIANVEGQGPNTNAEMRAVGRWLMDNAEDHGTVNVSHGQAIPGYNPEVKEYSANGVRFHVVRDQFGQYIYAYPDRDARLGGPAGAAQGRVGGGRNMPRLGESIKEEDMKLSLKPTLFEQLKWDEEIRAALKESMIDEEELDESSLSKKIGDQPGGQKLVQWLHRKHKLGNEAELNPQPFNERMLWKEFKRNPDNFVVVAATGGVAGIKPYEKMIRDRMEAARKKGKEYDPGGDSTLQYQIIAFTDDGQQVDPALLQPAREPGEEREVDPTVMKARMGKISGKDTQNPDNVFNLLADQIGTLRVVYLAAGGVEREKMKTRSDMKKEPEVNEMDSVKKIFKRVRPVLKTLGMQALSQINNRAKRYIDGGNFEAATKISQSGNKLKQFLATIDTSGEVDLNQNYGSSTKSFTDQIMRAVQAASGSRPGTPQYKEFLGKAASGSSMELKPVLDALRDSLVALT